MNDSICPDEVVSSSESGDLVGDCAIVSSASSSGLKGGICQDTFFRPAKVANFICQKQKEEFYINITTTEITTTSNMLFDIYKSISRKYTRLKWSSELIICNFFQHQKAVRMHLKPQNQSQELVEVPQVPYVIYFSF